MKRLLAIIIAITCLITALASCAKVVEDEGASDSELGSDSDNVGEFDIESDIGDTDNGGNNATDSNENNTANKETESGNTQEKPAFNGKESTTGLKYELNEDGLSYTVVSIGSASSTSIVIDGHNGLPITKVGYCAFADNAKITSVKLGDYVEIIEDQAFSMCKALTSVTFGKNVKFLGDYSFRYCTALTTVELGKNIETIKYGAFYKSSKLATIKAYNKIRIIEEYAFDGTAYFNNDSNWKNKVLYIGTNLVKAKSDISGSYTVTAGTTCIGGLAFYGCASISGITIPNSVHSIGLKAFANTTALKNISIGNGLTYIGERAFINSGYFKTSGNWTDNVLYIGDYLVAAKTGVNGALTVKAGTKVIIDLAFNACENMSSIVIPDSTVYIGCYAFRGCKKLSNVTIGSGVKEIGIYAFKDCSALKTITFKKTAGWSADNIEISADKITNKSDAVTYLGIVYSDKVWTRA